MCDGPSASTIAVMDTAQFRTRVERLWSTRPVRPAAPRTIAGVCVGIGNRYRVDPTLVKVAFVIATIFGGSGLVLYLAAWIACPSSSHAHTANQPRVARNGWHNNPTVLVILAIVIVATSIGSRGPWGTGGLVGVVLMLGGWWLLFLRTPEPPAESSVTTVAAPAPPQHFVRWTPRAVRTGVAVVDPTVNPVVNPSPLEGGTIDLRKAAAPDPTTPTADRVDESPSTEFLEQTPPSWDPLGAARFAWDLPEPKAPQPPSIPPGPRRSSFSFMVIGVAVLVAAGSVAANQLGAQWFTIPHILSLTLAVIGAGLLINGLRRHSSRAHPGALVPLAIGLAVSVIATTLLTTGGTDNARLGIPPGGVGERNWKPLSQNDIRDEYSLSIGSMTLDLRDIELTTDKTVHLRNGIGEIIVKVPAGMNVAATCSTGVGDYTCPEGLDGGDNGQQGPVLHVDARANVGSVKITR